MFRLTDTEISSNLLLVLLAGHDTSSTTLTRCLSNLFDHPWVMDKLRAEQQAVQAKHGQHITPAALKEMPFADAVLRWAQSLAHTQPQVAPCTLCGQLLCVKTIIVRPNKSKQLLSVPTKSFYVTTKVRHNKQVMMYVPGSCVVVLWGTGSVTVPLRCLRGVLLAVLHAGRRCAVTQ
jgi:hypothetical protein